ncbi:hypothetical protein ACFC0D_12865 [Streptomyces sp. NPDC056222]|uniref:hypothetical protein n=1 Tax=Streptomyces sp. NPDC056222 TaxID=3345749 RepID=UPI0035DB1F3F
MNLVTMSRLSVDLLPPLRHLLVPVLLLVAALVAVSCHGGGAGRFSAGPEDRGDLGSATAQAASRELAPQGGATTRRPSRRPSSSAARPSAPRSPSAGPSGASSPVAYEQLAPGECFDIDREAPGTVVRRGCEQPHDAQLVAKLRLSGDHAADRDIRDSAAALCREPLRREAAEQPYGTRWITFVQYPYRSSYLLGSDAVACSLAAHTPNSATGGTARKLTAPLQ